MIADLSLAEWTVLAVVDEAPTHGFAVARLTAREGELGRVWHIPRAVVYRAMGRLDDAGLVAPVGDVPGQGPQRRLVAATVAGSRAAGDWLEQPVRHVRDIRSHLLTKLALLSRRDIDPGQLLGRQRDVLAPIADALVGGGTDSVGGFDSTLAAWRRASSTAALTFLDEIAVPPGRRALAPRTPQLAERQVRRQVGPLP